MLIHKLTSALESAQLPINDLIEPGRKFFRFTEDDRLIGFVGWEINSDLNVLLRSLVIMPSERGKGAGKAIVVWALTRLAELGMENIFILTTTAEAFAIKLGFVRCDRQAVPKVSDNPGSFQHYVQHLLWSCGGFCVNPGPSPHLNP